MYANIDKYIPIYFIYTSRTLDKFAINCKKKQKLVSILVHKFAQIFPFFPNVILPQIYENQT